MQTVEIAIYIMVAVIAGGMLIFFITSHDWDTTYEQTNKLVNAGKELNYEVNKHQFIEDAYYYWEDCAFGTLANEYSVYINDGGTLTKQEIVDQAKKINKENELNADNLVMGSIMLPKILTITCSQSGLKIE